MNVAGYVIDVDNPTILRVFGEHVYIFLSSEMTNNDFSVIGQPCLPGEWSWSHRHRNEHHFIQVARGTIEFEIAGSLFTVNSPNSVFIPKMTWHRFRGVGSTEALMVFVNVPGGLEKMFGEIADREREGVLGNDEYHEIADRYGVDVRQG